MSAAIVYESEFGATRQIAESIAAGMREVTVVALEDVRDLFHPLVTSVDLLIVGAPTHARTMPTKASRAEALTWPGKPGSSLMLELHADLPGLREWLATQDLHDVNAAAFSTRRDLPRLVSGSAVPAIERALRRSGALIGASGKAFMVGADGAPADGELARAREWGGDLARTMSRAFAGGMPGATRA